MVAMSTPFKDPKNGIFKLRKRIPNELRPYFVNRKTGKPQNEYWQTLGTKDPKEAKRLFPDALAECETIFEAARAKHENRSQRLTDRGIQGLADEWLMAKLAQEQNKPSIDELNGWHLGVDDEIESKIWDRWVPLAAEILRFQQLAVLPTDESFDRLCEALAWAEVRYWKIALKRFSDDWTTETTINLTTFSRQQDAATLGDIAERKMLEEKTEGRRKEDFQRAVERFKVLHGEILINQITPRHVVQQKDQFVEQGLAAATTNKRLSDLSSILNYAKQNHIIPQNPAREIRAGGAKTTGPPRESYSKADLKALFSGPVHTKGDRPKAGQGEAAYWLPLVSLYSGARFAEIGQLSVSDVGETESDIPYLDINRIDGKRVKNNNSIRRIPIHKELIKRGFLGYVSTQSDRLFPGVDWAINKNGEPSQFGKAWGQWFGRYKEAQGITGKKDFHSFRHTFIDACKDASIDGDLWRKITGHAPQDVGGGYGSSDLLERLKKEIDKVKYEVVRLFRTGLRLG
jgi:integrase